MICCTDYEITRARLHSKLYDPGASVLKISRRCSQKLPPETIAFVLEFIHHPDSVEYSSYKTASCDGRYKSWISELLLEGNQPILWLKQNKSALYDRYKQECEKLEIKPISFRELQGISKLWQRRQDYVIFAQNLGQRISYNQILRSQHKPDITPELMSKAEKLKGYLLSECQANLNTHSVCATYCASLWLSDEPPRGNISQHQETCQRCLEIFHLIREIKCADCSNDP